MHRQGRASNVELGGFSLVSVEMNAASQRCFGLKAWDVTAWGGARSAQPQVRYRKELPSPERALPPTPSGVTAFQALERVWVPLTWACARGLASAQAVTGRAFSPQSPIYTKTALAGTSASSCL